MTTNTRRSCSYRGVKGSCLPSPSEALLRFLTPPTQPPMNPDTQNDGVLPMNLDDGTRLIASSMAGGAHKDAREDRMPAFIDIDRIERGDDTYVVTRLRYVPETPEQAAKAAR